MLPSEPNSRPSPIQSKRNGIGAALDMPNHLQVAHVLSTETASATTIATSMFATNSLLNTWMRQEATVANTSPQTAISSSMVLLEVLSY